MERKTIIWLVGVGIRMKKGGRRSGIDVRLVQDRREASLKATGAEEGFDDQVRGSSNEFREGSKVLGGGVGGRSPVGGCWDRRGRR